MAYVAGGIFWAAVICSYIGITYNYMTPIEHFAGPLLGLCAGLLCLGYIFLPRHHDRLLSIAFVTITGLFLLISQFEAAFITDNNMAFYQIWIAGFYLMLTFADRRHTRFRWTFVYFGVSTFIVILGFLIGNTSITDINGLLMVNALLGQLVIVAIFNILGDILRKAGAHEAQAKTLALSTERLKIAAEMAHVACKEAERASAAKSAFIANMSHELRTPLNAIIGFSDILSNPHMETTARERFAEYGADIHVSGKHLLSIVNDILDVAKIEAGRMDLFDEKIDFRDIIDDALSLVGPREALGKRQIKFEHLADDHHIVADPRMITQIVTNLLSNALKYTEIDGVITFDSNISMNGNLMLSVADNGTGIDEDTLATIMEPFVQGENVYARKNNGTGLGLHLVKLMMQMHDGQCEITSEIGRGTTVWLEFPAARVRTAE